LSSLLVATCQLSLADMPLTWLQAGEKYREWLVDQEDDEIKMISCYKDSQSGRRRGERANNNLSRPWRGLIKYPGGGGRAHLEVWAGLPIFCAGRWLMTLRHD